MAVKASAIITISEQGKGAFGVRTDTDEAIYVPVAIADAMDLEEFEEVEAVLIKNDRDSAPWRAVRVRRMVD